MQQERYNIDNDQSCKVFPVGVSGQFLVTMQIMCFIQADTLKSIMFSLKKNKVLYWQKLDIQPIKTFVCTIAKNTEG